MAVVDVALFHTSQNCSQENLSALFCSRVMIELPTLCYSECVCVCVASFSCCNGDSLRPFPGGFGCKASNMVKVALSRSVARLSLMCYFFSSSWSLACIDSMFANVGQSSFRTTNTWYFHSSRNPKFQSIKKTQWKMFPRCLIHYQALLSVVWHFSHQNISVPV